ncbi:hypothetical protein LCGC14_2370030 [marine sediment metagenome]|uniref:Uncharacterized protein n=1 Tax=marine sediment metagenome TaxID=412755 RepID=A0A0F9C438_9ZZZZ
MVICKICGHNQGSHVDADGQVLSAAAEAESDCLGALGPSASRGNRDRPSAAAPSAGLSTKEESDGQTLGPSHSGNAGRDGVPSGARSQLNLAVSLTHDQRVAIAQEIQNAEWNRQWFAGDVGNAWIEELGESAEQYLSDFGYQPESLSNILRVCAKIPQALRSSSLRFSHHVVVADLNLEDIDEWLGTCEIEQWSVAEFRRQVKGTKPRVKRWSLEELRALLAAWYEADAEIPIGEMSAFLDWLERR